VLRDIDQLSAAGVPVWGQQGRDGGFQLQSGWSTQLTGMTEAESQALLLAGLPQAAAELGLGQAATSARLKLLASVPDPYRTQTAQVAQRLHLDPLDWYRAPDTPAFLQQVAQAVWQGQRLKVRYESWKGLQQRTLDPLGLVLKAGAWYLVAQPVGTKTSPRTYRLASLQALSVLPEAAQRPKGFDLPQFWRDSSARFEAELRQWRVRLRASARAVGWLRNGRLVNTPQAEPAADGSQVLEMAFESEEAAARQLLGYGPEVEVLAPDSLRTRLAALAAAVAAIY
jgi:predicted DNA-binding transcriptional regulator YafY